MDENININWFPGHMAKAQRMIKDHLKLVDVVIELLDARIPYSSANPAIKDIIGDKPRVIALNKADLADPKVTEQWIAKFRNQNIQVVAIDSMSGKGTKTLVSKVEQLAKDKVNKLVNKGVNARAARAMILGIPNVGKSSLINRLLGTATVKTADKPGVTRGKQWIKVSRNLELLDTPGVLWPKFKDIEVGLKLAFTGAINDEVYDMEKVMNVFLKIMREEYPERLIERYNLKAELPQDSIGILEMIGAKRGCLRSGGIVDHEKVRRILLNEFRASKLGLITLDKIID
ncbi:MAG: ribosome biosis GTP-binding protein YlqF [Massilibacillus sp.]|jgi:ribosome biogenesis GTPase A|nr:ribosome biosis GTP-binding protein YlqF [Massilibacillus sp.]